MQFKSKFPLLFQTLELFALFFIVALVNMNSFIRIRQFPEVDNYSDHEWDYIIVALIAMLLMIFVLRENQLLDRYITAWKHNKLLMLFVLYSVITLFWTVYFPATLYKLIFLLFSTLAGAYIAVRYRLSGVADVLVWAGGIFAVLSILIVVYFPFIGTMFKEYFLGSWNGLFWHRNHTGNLFSFFNMIFLLRMFLDEKSSRLQKLGFVLLYAITAALVFGSRSATGVIVFLFLHLVSALAILWLKFHEKIQRWHYYLAGGMLLAGFLIFITNTEFFFGLLGRSASMTGRVPVWQDLWLRVLPERPLFGYGYGALWMQKSFRLAMQIRHNWTNQLYFADNGFFDILLNTGLVGLLLFLSVYCTLGWRSIQRAVSERSWLSMLPVVTFLYIFIGNLTYSFLLEVDQFVWMLLVIMLFLTNSPNSTSIPQPYSQPKNTKPNSER